MKSGSISEKSKCILIIVPCYRASFCAVMMDRSSRESESEETSGEFKHPDRVSSEDGGQIKICIDCGTSKTPLWRTGPAGPKTLCNACGIRNRKKKIITSGGSNDERRSKRTEISNENPDDDVEENKFRDNLTRKLMKIRSKMVISTSMGRSKKRSVGRRKKKMLGEEEQAAFLLMALSCGSAFTQLISHSKIKPFN